MIQAVLFDMDGTLIDTERLGIVAWNKTADEYGVDLPISVIKSFIGHNREDVLSLCAAHVGSDDLALKLYDHHREYEHAWVTTKLTTKDGAHECLRALRDTGYQLELVTSSNSRTAERNLRQFNLRDYFPVMTCGEEAENGKPAPDIYLMAAKKLGLAPEVCAVVEDSINGAKSGISAGMHTFVVPDMVELPADVIDACAGVLDSLHELPAAIEAM